MLSSCLLSLHNAVLVRSYSKSCISCKSYSAFPFAFLPTEPQDKNTLDEQFPSSSCCNLPIPCPAPTSSSECQFEGRSLHFWPSCFQEVGWVSPQPAWLWIVTCLNEELHPWLVVWKGDCHVMEPYLVLSSLRSAASGSARSFLEDPAHMISPLIPDAFSLWWQWKYYVNFSICSWRKRLGSGEQIHLSVAAEKQE